MSRINSKTLMIAAVALLVLALLFVATPLLRVPGAAGQAGFNQEFSGQNFPGAGPGTTSPGGQNGFPGLGDGSQGQGFTGPNSGAQNPGGTTNPARQFTAGGSSLLRFSFLSGMVGTVVYAIALLVSLVAALGMFLTKRWGQILGIVMGVVYLLLSLVSFIPMLLLGFARSLNSLSLGLSILHMVLAITVIVLAVIPAKKVMAPPVAATLETPPAAGA